MNRTMYQWSHPTTRAHYTAPFLCIASQVCQYDSRSVDEPNFSTDGAVSHDGNLTKPGEDFLQT